MSEKGSCLRSVKNMSTNSEKKPVAAAVQAVGVTFEIIEALAGAGEAVGVSELARRLGHTKARVHRHLVNLRELGFVEKDGLTDGYRLGWKIYRLGMSVAESFGMRKLAHPHLLRLRQGTEQTVILAAPAGTGITIVDAVQSDNDFSITVRPGSVIATTSSALGRTILAFQPYAVLHEVLAAQTSTSTRAGLPSHSELGALLERIRREWYELASNERLPGISSLACPIFDHRNSIAGSVAIIAHNDLFNAKSLPRFVTQVKTAAADISSELVSTAWEGAGRVGKRSSGRGASVSA